MNVIFSRETLEAWRSIFDRRQKMLLFRILFVIVGHVLAVWLISLLPSHAIDLSKIQTGSGAVSVRFLGDSQPPESEAQGSVLHERIAPSRPSSTPQLLPRSRTLTGAPSEGRPVIPVEPLAPEVGPQVRRSEQLSQLFPNSQKNIIQKARSYGENWGQENDDGGNGDGGQAIDVHTREYKYASYFSGLIRQIEQVWVYPQNAARAGMQGQAIYDIVISRDGSIQKLVSVQSTGYAPLDSEVERAVRAAAPYNPVPSRIDKDPLVVRIRFVYTLTHFGIF